MPPIVRLCVCLYLLATCSARPNWHHHQGVFKQYDNPILQEQALEQKDQATIENVNSVEQEKTHRSTREAAKSLSFGASFSSGGYSNFNNHPQFPPIDQQKLGFPLHQQQFGTSNLPPFGQFHPYDQEKFGPPPNHQPLGPPLGHQPFGPPLDHQQFGPQKILHPIGELASSLQHIISSHLEATVKHNKEVLFGTLNNAFHQPPALRPPCPLCNQQTHPFGETTHHLDIGHPQIISTGIHTHQFEITCQGGNGCDDVPMHIHPSKEEPFHMITEVIKEIPVTQPPAVSPTPSTEQDNSDKDTDIVYENDDKDSKTIGSENEGAGIDIRFGGRNPDNVLPSYA